VVKSFITLAPVVNRIELFLTDEDRNKLECLFLASLSHLVECFANNVGAYPSCALYKCSPLGLAPGITVKYQTRLKCLAKNERSSLFRIFSKLGRSTLLWHSLGQCNRTFYFRYLPMFAISYSVYHWKASPA
jgi:hypothetical protein